MLKISPITYLIITTAILVLVTVLVFFNAGLPIVFYLTCIGQVVLIFTIYKVLTDNYKTKKTFDDWYEDNPSSDEL